MENKNKDQLFHETKTLLKELKVISNILWIVIIAIGLVGSYLFFMYMKEMQDYSNIYSATDDSVMTNQFNKVIYEKKGIKVIIDEQTGETITNPREWAKKNYFKNLYLGVLMIAVTVGIIAFLIKVNKNVLKRKVHLEFKLEKLKYEGIEAAEEFEKKHPL